MELSAGGLRSPFPAIVGEDLLKILIFLKEVIDNRIPLPHHEKLWRLKKDWTVPRLNPADRAAVKLAAGLKESCPQTQITAIHLGPPSGERWIREALALGCDAGVRIWEEGLETVHSAGKALIFAQAADILGFDLILTGARSSDTMNEQVGVLLSAHLQIPCITSVIAVEGDWENHKMTTIRELSHGFRERVECPFPFVMTAEPHDEPEIYPSLPALLEAMEREIPCFDLAQLGIPRQSIRQRDTALVFGPLCPPKPGLKAIPAPDSSLPAFERIRKLLEGVLRPREGRLIQKDEEALAEEMFKTLLREGWLDHLWKDKTEVDREKA